jgi:thiol-disulfide isomerase/thioredoxin
LRQLHPLNQMPLSRVLAHTLPEFDAALQAALASGGKVFVLFTGAADPASGASWCPDCVDAKPALSAALEEAGAAGATTLVEVPLARAEYRGNAAHWARVHASVRLRAIPTLFKWGKAAKVGELVEGQCKDAASVRELVLE